MSRAESPTEQIVSSVFDTEKIISEVEKRPALYNKQQKEFSDRNLKEKLRGEVCTNVIGNWSELSGEEKQNKGKEVQKKWKNLKDCLARELAAQRRTVSGQAAKKRRKYIFFDQLLFLLPIMQDRATSGNIAPSQNNSENERDHDTSTILQSNTENNENIQSTPVRHVTKRAKEKTTPYETKLLRILEQKQSEEIDEDKNFALMLVPMLKKLTDDEKHYAKIEILNVMKRAKNIQVLPVLAPHMHRGNPLLQTYNHTTYNQPRPQIPTSNFQNQPGHVQGLLSTTSTNQSQNTQVHDMRNYYSQFSEDLLSSGSSTSDYCMGSPSTVSDSNSDLFNMSNQ